MTNHRSLLYQCVKLILQPAVRFCVLRGIKFRDFTELAKQSFVETSEQLLERDKKISSVSKISVMTGLQRPDVTRLFGLGAETPTDKKAGSRKGADHPGVITLGQRDIITSIVGQWASDRRFTDAKGKPKPLATGGVNSAFAKLVARVQTDLNPHTVRFELERLGLVDHRDGVAYLLSPANITSGDPVRALVGAASDSQDLLSAAIANGFLDGETPHLHARTTYDNIADEHRSEIQKWALALGREIHTRAREFLSRFDADITPTSNQNKPGRNRMVLGTFSFFEDVEKSLKKKKGKS